MNLDFDQRVFDELSVSLDTMFPEILKVFLEETENSLKEIDVNIDEGNLQAINDTVHKIKSSTKTFGAIGLVKLLEELESLDDKDLSKVTELNIQINQEYSLVKEYILSKHV